MLHPGKLALDYCNGIRKKYFKPLSLFLLLVVLYLFFPKFKGLNMELQSHLNNNFYGEYAKREIRQIMGAKNWNIQEVTGHYRVISEKASKFLLLLIIPIMALLSRVVLLKNKRPYFDHFIFAAEIASFFLLWGFLILPLLLSLIGYFIPLKGTFITSDEGVTGILLLMPFFIYIIIASRKFYGFSRFKNLAFSFLYVTGFSAFILTIYKFLLFFISLQFIR